MKTPIPFTPIELKRIAEWWPTHSVREIAKKLHRHPGTICWKVRAMGLPRKKRVR